MDARSLAERLDHVQLVDVRYDDEWRAGHIEGALHIPEDDLADRLDELDRSRPVVTVCRAGRRSLDAAEWLRGQGFDAEDLDGGMLAWKWAGLPVARASAEPEPEPQPAPFDVQAMHDGLIEIAMAIEERFGAGVQPSDEELKAFLRERLINEGRTPDEADAILAESGDA